MGVPRTGSQERGPKNGGIGSPKNGGIGGSTVPRDKVLVVEPCIRTLC